MYGHYSPARPSECKEILSSAHLSVKLPIEYERFESDAEATPDVCESRFVRNFISPEAFLRSVSGPIELSYCRRYEGSADGGKVIQIGVHQSPLRVLSSCIRSQYSGLVTWSLNGSRS